MKYLLLKENLQLAKKILSKYNTDIEDERFIWIRKLLKNSLGYLGLFTKFLFTNKASREQLQILYDLLMKHKSALKELPKQAVNYEKMEELFDDLQNLESWKEYNKFVQRLSGEFKPFARKDKELKTGLESLEEVEKIDLFRNFLPKISRYRSYEDFRESLFAYLANNTTKEKIIENIEKTEGAIMIHNSGDIIVAEIWTKPASCAIGSAAWCISGKYATHWETYMSVSSKSKQYFIWNFSVPTTNIDFMLGTTIKPNGSVDTSHLKDDSFISLSRYLDRYQISMDIFKPIDMKEEHGKFVKANGLTNEVIKILEDEKLIIHYKDDLPMRWRIYFGFINKEEILSMPQIERIIFGYTNEEVNKVYDKKGISVKHIFDFLNEYEDWKDDLPYDVKNHETWDYLELKKDHNVTKILKEMNFVHKIKMLNLHNGVYHQVKEYDDEGYEINQETELFLKEAGIEALFSEELQSSELLKEIYQVGHNRYITFDIKLDKEDYIEKILDDDEEGYYSLMGLESYGSYGNDYYLTDWRGDDEMQYISRYFGGEGENYDKYKEYVKKISDHVKHRAIPNLFTDFISKDENSDYQSEMDKLSNIDTEFESYFTEYMDDISDSAGDIVSSDVNLWNNFKMGEYDSSRDIWEVSLGEIATSLYTKDNTNINTLEEWIDSHPNDTSNLNMSYTDYANVYHYLAEADRTLASDNFVKTIEDKLEDEEFLEQLNNIKIIHTHLISKDFKDIVIEDKSKNAWRFTPVEVFVKKEGNSLVMIDCLGGIDYDSGETIIYIMRNIDEETSYDTVSKFKGLGNFEKMGNEDIKKYRSEMDKLGVSFKTVMLNIEEQKKATFDPNQLEFEFEKLKTFEQFIKNLK